MKLQNIKIADAKQSATNVKDRCNGPAFNELVASIKEKGVLVPVLARKIETLGTDKAHYEVVAGNRRLAAAKAAGLTEIPAQIVEMTDIEAREAQIIENLQREDVHPLDEGEAYRQLIEKSHYEISVVAAKVGKSESYVRQRLFITGLDKKAAEAFRQNKITVGHAILIARLEPKQQELALKECTDSWTGLKPVKRLKEWIEEKIYQDLSKQSWLNDKKLVQVLGSCGECPSKAKNTLFPDKNSPSICPNPDCYAVKMEGFIKIKMKEAKDNGEELIKISDDHYCSLKGVVSKSDYRALDKKDECEFEVKGIVVDGTGIGTIHRICMDKDCKKHSNDHSAYALTPAEKAARKKEAEKAKKQAEKNASEFQAALKKIKFPLSEKQLDALFDFAFYRCGVSFQQPMVKLVQAEVVKKEEKTWDGKKTVMRTNYQATLRAWAEKDGPVGKLRVIFGLIMPFPHQDYMDEFNKAVKKL